MNPENNARLSFKLKDRDGNLVDFETSGHDGKELVSNYSHYLKFLTDSGFTPLKERSFGKPKEKITFDGKTCPVCKSQVYDNRTKKAEGTYKATAPDYACSNKECKGGTKGGRWAVWPGQYEIAPRETGGLPRG